MSKKCFIFGSNGMLGNYVTQYVSRCFKIIPLTRNEYDLENLSYKTLESLFEKKTISSNDVIINCAGVIPHSSKQHEIGSRQYYTINSLFPVLLSKIADKFECNLIHITTDCVFSGNRGNYKENDKHDETNDYGISKSLGELCNATIIRTSIIGEEVNNKRSLLEWVISNKNGEINGFTNHFWNGLTCLQLSKIINDIISKSLYWKGVKHIYTPKAVSKYELVSSINEVYKLNIKINMFTTNQTIDKTINSLYEPLFVIPDLKQQIKEQMEYKLI